jgi:acyl-coenzyme A synthetase/AMP-(fatty) acid ligase
VSDLDAAHLSYTSGSSGAPKGALLAHGYTARATHTIAERLNLSSADVSLGVTSLSSSFHLVANLLPGVHRAMSIGVRKDWNPEVAWQEMDDRGVTFFAGNPLVLGDLLKVSREKGQKPRALSRCVSGGAPLPPDVKVAFSDEFDVQIVESYGQSELGGFVALGYPRRESDSRFYAIGPGLPDRETIVADEGGREVPMGQPGELLIRNNVMIGYWNMPEKTAEALRDGYQ